MSDHDRRKDKRFDLSGFVSDISSGAISFGGNVVDISSGGFKVTNLPKMLEMELRNYETVISGYQQDFRLVIRPQWFQLVEGSRYMEAGFKFIEAPIDWKEFINNLLSMELQGNKPVLPGQQVAQLSSSTFEVNEVDELIQRAMVENEATSHSKGVDKYRAALFNCLKSLYLFDKKDHLSTAMTMDRIWKQAESQLSTKEFFTLQNLVNQDIELIVKGKQCMKLKFELDSFQLSG